MNKPEYPPNLTTTVLIIGAYGLVGYGITKRLIAEGYRVVGLGRDISTVNRVLPHIDWTIEDVSALRKAVDWGAILQDVSVVVNCSGALQDGPGDNLEALHHHAVSALASACVSADIALIQISAVGARLDASTPFLASKARGDTAIKASGVKYHIFRPGLVVAPHAYGGTTLLRSLAAFPVVQPIALPDAQIQTISLADLANVVSAAISAKIPTDYEADLVESETHRLADVVASVRYWLGFAAARREVRLPVFLTNAIIVLANSLSFLGWRSPVRSNAIKVLTDGVVGRPTDLSQFGLPSVTNLSQTLAVIPVGAEDRLFARMSLLMPLVVATLCLFWLASGVIGLARVDEAAFVLEKAGWSHSAAVGSVIFWAIIDIGIATAFAIRKLAKAACWIAIVVSVFYVFASTLFVPELWIDPLGPLIKVLPGIMLTVVARVVLDSR